MYYLYYDNDGSITTVTNKIASSFGAAYIEIDLQVYLDFSNSVKHTFDYIVIKNSKIAGKMHLALRDIGKHDKLAQLSGIINKQDVTDNSIIINQDITNGWWTFTSTMDDITCSLFAQGADHIKEYYVVDSTNRYILLDTLQVNLKTLAEKDTIAISNYKKNVCKQAVSLLCGSHHVKHIHIVRTNNENY